MESNSVNGNKIKRIEFNLYTMFGYEQPKKKYSDVQNLTKKTYGYI